MKNYKIEVSLKITDGKDYEPKVYGSTTITKTAVLPASKVREEATKLVRNSVLHFSESVALGLAENIETEPKLDGQSEPETLTV